MASNINIYSTLDSEHNWEDQCMKLKNQQTRTYDNHNEIRGGPIFNPVFANVSS